MYIEYAMKFARSSRLSLFAAKQRELSALMRALPLFRHLEWPRKSADAEPSAQTPAPQPRPRLRLVHSAPLESPLANNPEGNA